MHDDSSQTHLMDAQEVNQVRELIGRWTNLYTRGTAKEQCEQSLSLGLNDNQTIEHIDSSLTEK